MKLGRKGTAKKVGKAGIGSAWSVRSLISFASLWSIGSAGSVGSLLSFMSVLSIGSSGSILSIGSAGSILSIGSAGSILSIGDAGKSPGGRPREAPGAAAQPSPS